MQRKLTVIVSADVVGYSRLMEADEAGTLAHLKAHRNAIFDPCVAKHGGRIVKLMGDGALVEFASVVSAVSCAHEIQQATESASGAASPDRIRYRIGINLGEGHRRRGGHLRRRRERGRACRASRNRVASRCRAPFAIRSPARSQPSSSISANTP